MATLTTNVFLSCFATYVVWQVPEKEKSALESENASYISEARSATGTLYLLHVAPFFEDHRFNFVQVDFFCIHPAVTSACIR